MSNFSYETMFCRFSRFKIKIKINFVVPFGINISLKHETCYFLLDMYFKNSPGKMQKFYLKKYVIYNHIKFAIIIS